MLLRRPEQRKAKEAEKPDVTAEAGKKVDNAAETCRKSESDAASADVRPETEQLPAGKAFAQGDKLSAEKASAQGDKLSTEKASAQGDKLSAEKASAQGDKLSTEKASAQGDNSSAGKASAKGSSPAAEKGAFEAADWNRGKTAAGEPAEEVCGLSDDAEIPDIPLEDMSVNQLQNLVYRKMKNNGPVTDRMKKDITDNIWKNSLINWVKSFR